jgi:hypothetical protein
VVESDLCSDAYWLALCIWASLETGSKIVFNHLTSSFLLLTSIRTSRNALWRYMNLEEVKWKWSAPTDSDVSPQA